MDQVNATELEAQMMPATRDQKVEYYFVIVNWYKLWFVLGAYPLRHKSKMLNVTHFYFWDDKSV